MSPASDSLTITVNVGVSAPTNLSFAVDSNLADGITNNSDLVISGTAIDGVTVELFESGVTTGLTAPVTGTSWSIPLSGLADGTYQYTARATDEFGNVSGDSSELAITVDTVAPAKPATPQALDDQGVVTGTTGDQTLSFQGTVEANSTVTVTIDGADVITTADGSGAWLLDFTGTTLSNGDHTISVTATDVAGNVSPASDSLVITIATTVNQPLILGIADDSNIPSDGITNDNTIQITGTADANVNIDVYIDGTNIGSTTSDESGDWIFINLVPLLDATYEITAVAYDDFGNRSIASGKYNVVIDTVAPQSMTFSPAQNASAVQFDEDLVISFNERVYTRDGFVEIRDAIDNSLVDQLSASSNQITGNGSNQITITLSNNLYGGSNFYVLIDEFAFVDEADNAFVGINNVGSSWRFSTVETALTGTVPVNLANDVSLNQVISLLFNEEVQIGSGNLLIRNISNNQIWESLQLSNGNASGSGSNRIDITLSKPLEPNTGYYVELTPNAIVNRRGVGFDGFTGAGTLSFNTIDIQELFGKQQVFQFDTTSSGAGVSSDITNFPLLIEIENSAILSSVQIGAPDIRFVDDDGITNLPYEIEKWTSSSAVVWVLVPQLDGASNRDFITMYYDDVVNGTVADGQNPDAVWGDYSNVYHFNEANGAALDSTLNENHGLEQGSVARVDGIIGNSADFDTNYSGGSINADKFVVPFDSSFDLSNQSFSIEMWVDARDNQVLCSQSKPWNLLSRGSGSKVWRIQSPYTNVWSICGIPFFTSDNYQTSFRISDNSGSDTLGLDFKLSNVLGFDFFQHVVVVHDINGGTKVYYDGEEKHNDPDVRDTEIGADLVIGFLKQIDSNSIRNFNIIVDEVRLIRQSISPARIKLSWENQRRRGQSLVSPWPAQ